MTHSIFQAAKRRELTRKECRGAEKLAHSSGTKLEPGTLYAALTRLERRGWTEPLKAEERRRPYRITAALREQLATMDQIVSTGKQRLSLA